ncbi:MAG: glycosyltransferase [bacterium]|nr:glycosyltransferase [bacterium]
MKKPLVSVIIPAWNSAAFIVACLQSLKKQTYKNMEIIVVDNNSSDDTVKLAKDYTDKVYRRGPERSAQVNYGARMAKGKYLYRVDSDFVLEPAVIAQCVQMCEKENFDGIAVHNTSAEGLGFWADVRKYERNTYIDDNLIVAVRFFTKESWKKINGFDEALYGPEDYDFHNRFVSAGFKWGRIEAIERHLGEPKSIRDIWSKHYFYGKHMVAYFRKHPKLATQQFNPVRGSYLRHFEILLTHPVIFVGLVVMTVVKFTAGGLGFVAGLIYLTKNEKN